MSSFLTHHRRRILVTMAFLSLFMAGLCGQLGYLMIFRSEHYSAMADDLHERERTIKAARGEIVDRNGTVIASNRTVCTVSVVHNQVEEPEAAQVEQNLAAVKKFAELTGGQVLLGLIPTAAEVWRDKLPAGAPSLDQPVLLQRAAEETGLPTVDMLGALSEHAAEPIYYRTDHHWTTRGAFYGANALLEALGRDPLEESSFRPETASTDFNGTLYSTSGIHWLMPDTIEYWAPDYYLNVTTWKSGRAEPGELYDRSYLEHKDQYSSFLGGNQPLCVIENPDIRDGSKILLIRDSYSDSLAPFLAQRFAQVHLIDLRYYHASVAEYMAQHSIKTAAVLYSTANFISDRNLFYLSR